MIRLFNSIVLGLQYPSWLEVLDQPLRIGFESRVAEETEKPRSSTVEACQTFSRNLGQNQRKHTWAHSKHPMQILAENLGKLFSSNNMFQRDHFRGILRYNASRGKKIVDFVFITAYVCP